MTNEELHEFRKQIDACIVKAESVLPKPGDMNQVVFACEMALVRTKLQEAKMWAGKCLEVAGSAFPKALADKAD